LSPDGVRVVKDDVLFPSEVVKESDERRRGVWQFDPASFDKLRMR